MRIEKNLSVETIADFFDHHNFDYMFNKENHCHEGRIKYFKKCDTFCFMDVKSNIIGLLWLYYNDDFEAYEPHVCFLKAYRGKTAVMCCKEWRIDYLPSYGKLRGLTPKKWKHAALFAKLVGFTVKNEKEGFYLMEIQS